ncbi:MAG TPA: serine/threonine-protein kinase [Gemmatimonadaceae bacterium]|nr:serine/threonine-protein kinase [Gemmatimonadaceae bacterium]
MSAPKSDEFVARAVPRTSGSVPRAERDALYHVTYALPRHLAEWKLPPGWRWGAQGVMTEHRHYQEVVDALDRSLSLVTTPNPLHFDWLAREARLLAHFSHPSIPVTYHYWVASREVRRGPGYLRGWIAGETLADRLKRESRLDFGDALTIIRSTGSALAYVHDSGVAYGFLSPSTVWVTPSARVWLPWWHYTSAAGVPAVVKPDRRWIPAPPEWHDDLWVPTVASDQWHLAATFFAALAGELPPSRSIPPLRWVRPDVPQDVGEVIDRALSESPEERFPTTAALLRTLDRAIGSRTVFVAGTGPISPDAVVRTEEERLRWALGDDYEVLAALGSGTFGSVWRVRDLSLEREVALKMLHPDVGSDQRAVARFRREARLAAQLAHPAIVPIFDWDSRGDVVWYTMELAEGGSLAQLIERSGPRSGPRTLEEIAPQVDLVLDALATAHAHNIIHRDLKPENILLDRYRRLRIADFGVANVVDEEVGGATGTPDFAAPEQLLGEPQGPQVDVFGVAALMYYVLTGAPPFGTGDAKAILGRQLSRDVDLAHFPPELAQWLARGLAPTPEERFADAAEMRAAFREMMERLPRHAAPWWRRWLDRGPDHAEA